MKKTPVIIDCDPGYDDALALVLALGNEALDVRAITAVAGNVPLERTYKNVVRICQYFDKKVRIGSGAVKPLVRDLECGEMVHSPSGLGGVTIPEEVSMPKKENAIEVIQSVLEESDEKVTIIAIGPLTNIALFVSQYPEMSKRIQEIVIMGGAAREGNRTASAEFNIYADAEAARIVFESGIPVVMAGLDVTNAFQIMPETFSDYRSMGKTGVFVSQVLERYFDFYQTLGGKFKGPAIHDMVPVAYVIDPSVCHAKEYHVDVECHGEFTYGRTVVDFGEMNPNKNVKVLFESDHEKIIDMFKKSIDQLNQV
ncbi:pyrimidine-specific ribonucleoside hydrolase RihA [Gottschalkiaceae bacterium SANA]|nr:pyrimidine-specific ribonucleoside hydrolase RihA [Gottschalkiaceae bacterium SANA]